MIGMAWIRKWTPQNAKDKRLAQAQSTRLYTFYFSEPKITLSLQEKPILSRRDEVLLNEFLAQNAQ